MWIKSCTAEQTERINRSSTEVSRQFVPAVLLTNSVEDRPLYIISSIDVNVNWPYNIIITSKSCKTGLSACGLVTRVETAVCTGQEKSLHYSEIWQPIPQKMSLNLTQWWGLCFQTILGNKPAVS